MNRYIYCFAITILTSACGFLDIDTPGIVSNDKMFENGRDCPKSQTLLSENQKSASGLV